MKKTVLICVAATAVVLTACTPPRFLTRGVTPFDNKNPRVYIVGDKYIVVDQEPIVFPSGEKGRIKWHLDDKANYRFDPGSGISGIKSLSGKRNDIKDCHVDDKEGSAFSCQNDNTGPETYKYSIVITRKKDNSQLPILDPTIGND